MTYKKHLDDIYHRANFPVALIERKFEHFASAILDLWSAFWDDPQTVFKGLYHCAKFSWNRCSHFDSTKVLIF